VHLSVSIVISILRLLFEWRDRIALYSEDLQTWLYAHRMVCNSVHVTVSTISLASDNFCVFGVFFKKIAYYEPIDKVNVIVNIIVNFQVANLDKLQLQ